VRVPMQDWAGLPPIPPEPPPARNVPVATPPAPPEPPIAREPAPPVVVAGIEVEMAPAVVSVAAPDPPPAVDVLVAIPPAPPALTEPPPADGRLLLPPSCSRMPLLPQPRAKAA